MSGEKSENKNKKIEAKDTNDKSPNEDLEKTEQAANEQINTIIQCILNYNNLEDLLKYIEELKTKISSASKSITSIPKALKSTLSHFDKLEMFYEANKAKTNLSSLADVISCVAIINKNKDALCLKYKLESDNEEVSLWGHEYVRQLTRQIIMDYEKLDENMSPENNKIQRLISKIIAFNIASGLENETIDFLLEVGRLDLLVENVDASAVRRVCSYLLACRQYIPTLLPQNEELVRAVFELNVRHGLTADALVAALLGQNEELAVEAFCAAKTAAERLQMAFIVGEQGENRAERMWAFIKAAKEKSAAPMGEAEEAALLAAMGREGLSERFLWLAEKFSVTEVRNLEDIFKSHLIDRSTFNKYEKTRQNKTLDSARENLAAAFANGFVHAGFGVDVLASPSPDGAWVFQNKGDGMTSAAGSVGLVHLWGLEKGFQAVDQYCESAEANVNAGGLLGFGLVGCGIRSDLNASAALLRDHAEGENGLLKRFAIIGLGLSAVGSEDEELASALDGAVTDYSNPDQTAVACLAYGLMFAGSCKDRAIEGIFDALLAFADRPSQQSNFLMMAVGLALVFIESNEKSEGIIEALEALGPKVSGVAKALVRAFAFAGSGNVIVYHEALKEINSNFPQKEGKSAQRNQENEAAAKTPINAVDKTAINTEGDVEMKGDSQPGPDGLKQAEIQNETGDEDQAVAGEDEGSILLKSNINVIALALISLGDKLSGQMSYRVFDDLLRYEGVEVRRAVPLALAAAFASRPDYAAVQLLGKLAHDADAALAVNAILALGLVAAGTNNSRVAKILRNLAVYYQKDADHLFVTRVCQGLVHCGKGLLTLSPLHFDGLFVNRKALAGLLIVLMSCLDMKKGNLGDRHYILFFLSLALRPRMLMTVDEAGNPLTVSVRVGTAAQGPRLGGDHNTITGFQTQTTPVLLSVGEKAELATKKYIALSSYLEGVVVLRENPEFKDAMEDE